MYVCMYCMQMADPLTALIHAVQVMNLLKTLIWKTIGERQESTATALFTECNINNARVDEEAAAAAFDKESYKETTEEKTEARAMLGREGAKGQH